jgi:anti-sigma factor RsiW
VTARIIPFDAATHKVAHVLLPWWVNGTLKGDELALVQRHLDECPQCRHEVEWLRELHAACIAGESMPGASVAFRNLRRELEESSEGRDSLARLRQLRGRTRRWWQWAVAAEFAMIVVLGGLLLTSADGPALYQTLSASTAKPAATGSLVVVFDPATPQAEVQRILRSAGARIVDGPTQANAYVLEVPPGQTGRAAQAIKAERATLLIESLGPQSAR